MKKFREWIYGVSDVGRALLHVMAVNSVFLFSL